MGRIQTCDEKASRTLNRILLSVRTENAEQVDHYRNLGAKVLFAASAYAGLGNYEFPSAIGQIAIPILEDGLIGLSDIDARNDIRQQIAKLRLTRKLAQEKPFGFKVFPWDRISNLPRSILSPIGSLVSSIVEDEQYLYGEISCSESPYWPGAIYIAPDPLHITTLGTITGIYNGVDASRVPIPLSPEITGKSQRVMRGYEKVRFLLPPHCFDCDLSKRVVPSQIIKLKEEVEVELVRLVVRHVVEPYLEGKPRQVVAHPH